MGAITAAVIGAAGAAYAVKKQGDAASGASDAQQRSNAASQKFIEQQAALARGDAQSLFARANQRLSQGYQQSLDTVAGITPQQGSLVNQGYTQAAGQLAQGGNMAINAILGKPMGEFSQLQPMQVDWSTITNAKLPEYGGTVAGKPPVAAGAPSLTEDQRLRFKTLRDSYHASLTPAQKALQGRDFKASLTPEQANMRNELHALRQILPPKPTAP